MDTKELVRVLETFTDSKMDVDLSRGHLVMQLRDDLVDVLLVKKEGELYVEEAGVRTRAMPWLLRRVARIDALAEHITMTLGQVPHFVVPGGRLLDQIEVAPEPTDREVPNILQTLAQVLGRRTPAVCSIIYLTSDAGEGKTSVINQLAYQQALGFRKKETDWLLVPVALGGRPFLRFDEVVVGSLLNRFRFPLYFEAFIELVRLGCIVPALDGFEELFIESPSGDAVSALGSLVQTLQGDGTVLIAARKAYFDYKGLGAQTTLYDTLRGSAVSFARVGLSRWDRGQFIEYCRHRELPEAHKLFEEFSERLGEDHPVLTRAVLVKRLIDLVLSTGDRDELLNQLSAQPQDFFTQFVDSIIKREVEEKWIDKVGTPASPLLDAAQHHELLSNVAQEMWTGGTTALRGDVVDSIAQLYCEQTRQGVAVSRQVVERLKHHALISQVPLSAQQLMFDHEEFFHYFLGESAANLIARAREPDVRQVLARGPLPQFAVVTAVHAMRRKGAVLEEVLQKLQRCCQAEGPASYCRENAGAIIMELIHGGGDIGARIEGVLFPQGCLKNRRLGAVRFVSCHFQATTMQEAELVGTVFESCTFERLELSTRTSLKSVRMEKSVVHILVSPHSDMPIYEPTAIEGWLQQVGVLPGPEAPSSVRTEVAVKVDDNLKVTQRALRCFDRATQLNEGSLRQQLGTRANLFFNEVLPKLLRSNILKEVEYRGSGQQQRFGLGLPVGDIERALSASGGHFEGFLAALQTRKKG